MMTLERNVMTLVLPKQTIIYVLKEIYQSRLSKFECKIILLSLLVIQVLLGSPHQTWAQTEKSSTSLKTESSLVETRRAYREPSFLKQGSGLRWQGIFFGVGFRHLRFTPGNGTEVASNQPDLNGIGFQIGLLQEELAYEYERQVSIIDSEKNLSFQNESGSRFESIQNTFSFSWYPRLMRDLHAHFGAGLQGSRTRFVGSGSSSGIHSETAIQLNLGGVYFATENLMLSLRISQSLHLPLSRSESSPMLKNSQIRTLFLNYYYPL